MALGSTFWSTSGLAALWHDLTSLQDGVIFGTANGVKPLYISCCKIYQEPMGDGGDGDLIQKNPGYNSGYFYMVNTSTGAKTCCNGVWLFGTAEPDTGSSPVANGQWVRVEPYNKIGDIAPAILPTVANRENPQGPLYKTGFLLNYDAANPAYIASTRNLSMEISTDASISGTWRLWHYSPYAWSGTPPEVVAAAAMHAGMSSDDIDTSSFDAAHDAFDLSTGDSPWTSLDDKWTIYARRIVGSKVADFLLECINHCRDLIFVNEAGQLSLSSWTSPEYSATGLDAKDDQILDTVKHTMTIKHLFNSVNASWGAAVSQSWGVPNATSNGPLYNEITASEDPGLESKFVDKWRHEETDPGSIAKFGAIFLQGRRSIVSFKGQPREVRTAHYPYLLSPHVNRATLHEWDAATDGGGMLHVTNWLTSDAKPRAEVEIRQGPMGFDTGIGDLITDLEITGDGRTIEEARIIERTYNFDSMTIDSLVLEIPPNT